jgi:hypothetical protein
MSSLTLQGTSTTSINPPSRNKRPNRKPAPEMLKGDAGIAAYHYGDWLGQKLIRQDLHKDTREALELGLSELSILTGIAWPNIQPTQDNQYAEKGSYIDREIARKTYIAIIRAFISKGQESGIDVFTAEIKTLNEAHPIKLMFEVIQCIQKIIVANTIEWAKVPGKDYEYTKTRDHVTINWYRKKLEYLRGVRLGDSKVKKPTFQGYAIEFAKEMSNTMEHRFSMYTECRRAFEDALLKLADITQVSIFSFRDWVEAYCFMSLKAVDMASNGDNRGIEARDQLKHIHYMVKRGHYWDIDEYLREISREETEEDKKQQPVRKIIREPKVATPILDRILTEQSKATATVQ